MKVRSKINLTWLQMVAVGILLVIGVLFWCGSQPYRIEYEAQEIQDLGGSITLEFLQKGSYTVEITYENSPSDNEVYVYSDSILNADNLTGAFLVQERIPQGSGVIRHAFSLEQGAYNVQITPKLEMTGDFYFSSVILQSNQLIHKDNYFLGAVLMLGAVVLLWCFAKLPGEKYRVPLALVCIGVLASLPVFSESLLGGDDLEFHLTRLEGIYLGLSAGEFPVRITSQQMAGFGGLTATMYPQLFLYPFAVLRFLDVSLMVCYKCLIVAMNVGAAFASYYGVKTIVKSERIAFWTSLLYTFSAYRLNNMYVRAAVGESLAMVFLPVVLWGTYEILWGKRRWLILALGMTGLLGSHLISVEVAVMFMAVELICWLVSRKKNQFVPRLLDGVKAVAMTVVLNLSFLVPFLYYSGEDLQCFILPYELQGAGVYFSQMFALFPTVHGANLAEPYTNGEMALSLGAVLLVGVILFVYAHRKERDLTGKAAVGVRCLLYGVGAAIAASWIFPWGKIANLELLSTVLKNLQFPWRLLAFATVFLCVVTAIGLDKLLEERQEYGWICALVAGMLIVTGSYIFDGLSNERAQITDKMWVEGRSLADGMYLYCEGDEFEPLQLQYNRRMNYIETKNGAGVEFSGLRREGTDFSVEILVPDGKTEQLVFPVYWYPGYEAKVDGNAVPVERVDNRVAVEVSGEDRVVEISYRGFWFFTLADVLSLVGFCGVLGIMIYKGVLQKKKRAGKSPA